jgi:polyisoprenoid-binding protein YceI
MKQSVLGAMLILAALVGACSTRLDPPRSAAPAIGAGGQLARPGTAGTTPTGTTPGNTKQVIALSEDNTRITFIGSAGSTSHEGTFDKLSGRWDLPTDDPKDSRLKVRIEVDSLRTKIPLLTAHLKRSDFLDAKQYPVATFDSTQVLPEPSPTGTTHRVTGEFVIHGVAQTLTFPARMIVTQDAASFEATLPVAQTAFGMTAGAEKAKNEVPVTVTINARRQ